MPLLPRRYPPRLICSERVANFRPTRWLIWSETLANLLRNTQPKMSRRLLPRTRMLRACPKKLFALANRVVTYA